MHYVGVICFHEASLCQHYSLVCSQLEVYVIFGALATEPCCHCDTCYGNLTDRLLLGQHAASAWSAWEEMSGERQPEMMMGDKEVGYYKEKLLSNVK